jgi:PAS domain-containing protein
MGQKPIELILARQLATSLAMPTFLVDGDGTLVFYNEPAERILGMRFEETGEMPAPEWAARWRPTGVDGAPLPAERLPLTMAVAERRPAHEKLSIAALDGTRRHIAVTAIPLVRADGLLLGSVAFFWETPP